MHTFVTTSRTQLSHLGMSEHEWVPAKHGAHCFADVIFGSDDDCSVCPVVSRQLGTPRDL
jgi:hypothetical protein